LIAPPTSSATSQAHTGTPSSPTATSDPYSARLRSSLGDSRTEVLTIPAGETHKTRDTWARLTDELLAAGFGRDSTIVALGGGVVGDLAGFVAATFMRGVPFVQLPTTLLAMIDASVGGKTGVDTVAGKNLVGAFHQPSAVIVDTSVLATLPREHLRAGMAEAIKRGVIASEAYFDSVVALATRLDTVDVAGDAMLDLVAGSIEIKADVVRRDEREAGVRKTLNFGHTLGHAVELCSGYGVLHGEAVAIGMVYEAALAERLGIAAPGTASRVRRPIVSAGLSDTLPASITSNEVVAATRGDKKARAGSRVRFAGNRRRDERAHGRWSVPVSGPSFARFWRSTARPLPLYARDLNAGSRRRLLGLTSWDS
jgi:3-dehydroquinate synthase